MSYTLRGRIESRLAAAALPFLAACVIALVLRAWWPVQVVGLMTAVGLALDALVYRRLLPYQPGWSAVPLGLGELAATMAAVRVLEIDAPLEPALWLFAGSWLVAQVCGHAVFPLARLTYAEDGGELGWAGRGLLVAAPAAVLLALGTAWATQPPTVFLEAGVHQGPLVLDHSQVLVGKPGAVVRGGIVIESDDVTVRNVTVVGGENGIVLEEARDVRLEDVSVSEATMDGVHARRSSLTIEGCTIRLTGRYAQGIDISFAFDLPPSRVEDCTVEGGQEGIVSHMSHIEIRENTVRRTTMRAIAVTEMSMGRVTRNQVEDVVGVGIYCGDYSQCDIARNLIRRIRPDRAAGDRLQRGVAIASQFYARAQVEDNAIADSPGGVRETSGGTIEERD